MQMPWWKRRLVRWGGGLLGISLLAIGLMWWQTRPDGRFHIIAPALEGDALLLITPHGNTILVDGSSDAVGITAFVGEHVAFWQRSLDAIVLTHADEQRLPGMVALVRRYSIKHAVLPLLGDAGQDQALRDELTHQNVDVAPANAQTRLTIDGVTFTVLQADAPNGGMGILVQYGQFKALLAPHSNDDQARQIQASNLNAAVLWWSWTRADDRTIAQHINAQAVVYSHGSGAVQQPRSFFQRGSSERQLLHEDVNGTIKISSDGTHMWIKTDH